MLCKNLTVSEDGRLFFAGMDAASLAREYKTPLYLMDEARIRENCRTYRKALRRAFGENALCLYAGKAASFRGIYRLMQEEDMGIDVVSCGEIYTARAAGFDLSRAYFHGNNKTDEDLAYALEAGVGCFVVDNEEELLSLNRLAGEKGIHQNIFLRITPGIDPHTYEAVATGKVDSKFGFAMDTGAAEEIVEKALAQENLILAGLHCHVGSQVFDSQVFFATAHRMLGLIKAIGDRFGYEIGELDLGGGYGVRYRETDPEYDLEEQILSVGAFVREECSRLGISCPRILMEPGRSIVADAGLALYTVGSVKQIPGYKNYVSVDGGMADNPRYALYGSPYTVLLPEKMQEHSDFLCSVVGRCCECGDILQENVLLPASVKRGDILAVCTAGAYQYSMASNYNRLPRPLVLMIAEGTCYPVIKRESFDDLIHLDL